MTDGYFLPYTLYVYAYECPEWFYATFIFVKFSIWPLWCHNWWFFKNVLFAWNLVHLFLYMFKFILGHFSSSSKIQNGGHFQFLSKYCPDYFFGTNRDRDMGFSLFASHYLVYVPIVQLELYNIQNGCYYVIYVRIKCFQPKFQLCQKWTYMYLVFR